MAEEPRVRLRFIPRTHAALIADENPEIEHAAAPGSDVDALCGVVGANVRHLFEDRRRERSCPQCQAIADGIRAADLLGGVRGAVLRGELNLDQSVFDKAGEVEAALLALYPADPTQPNFDVYHR